MAKDEVLFGYAMLDDAKQTVISIDDIDRPYAKVHKFFCPHCHNEMYATFGEVQLPHFRHNGDKCQHSKYLHDLAEHVFYEEYSKCLDNGWPFLLELRIPTPCNKSCVLKKHVDCMEHHIQKTVDLTKEYTLISLETRVDIDNRYRRPDVLLESNDGKQLWVEIWVSHETEDDKRRDGRIIEIKIDTERDLEKIRNHKIVQSEGEDPSVRIFGIETDGGDDLFMDEEFISNIKYPCEKYYCFEAGTRGVKAEVLDYISTTVSSELSYRVVLRLNWKGYHNSTEGISGKPISEKGLQTICAQRYRSNVRYDKFYDSLIVFEWKSESFKPTPVQNSILYYDYKDHHQPIPLSAAPVSIDVSDIEWVDLGLPSGTLWAKDDINEKSSFMGTRKLYGSYVPSKANANELIRSCDKKWDNSTRTLELIGPNGSSIFFHCKGSYKSYWLNAFEKGDPGYGQCFHIEPDGFRINDKDSTSLLFVRLVKR